MSPRVSSPMMSASIASMKGPQDLLLQGQRHGPTVAVSNPKLGVDSSFPVDFGVPKFESPPCLLADSFERDVLKKNMVLLISMNSHLGHMMAKHIGTNDSYT